MTLDDLDKPVVLLDNNDEDDSDVKSIFWKFKFSLGLLLFLAAPTDKSTQLLYQQSTRINYKPINQYSNSNSSLRSSVSVTRSSVSVRLKLSLEFLKDAWSPEPVSDKLDIPGDTAWKIKTKIEII